MNSDGTLNDLDTLNRIGGWVEEMDSEYESHIASGGANISGGQKQRLS